MTETELVRLMHLCRIECTEEEKNKLGDNLSRILLHVADLQHIDTSDVPPCRYVCEETSFAWREDVVSEEALLSPEEFLVNTPVHTARMVKIPPIKI